MNITPYMFLLETVRKELPLRFILKIIPFYHNLESFLVKLECHGLDLLTSDFLLMITNL